MRVAQPAGTAQAYRRNGFELLRGAARLNKTNKPVHCALFTMFIPIDQQARPLSDLGVLGVQNPLVPISADY